MLNRLDKPVWVKMSEDELKSVILSLADKHSSSQIGFILRDQYGIPTTRVFGKKIKQYLVELCIDRNEELENAERKVDGLKEHLKNNRTDRKAKHKLQKAQGRLQIVRRYYGISRKRK